MPRLLRPLRTLAADLLWPAIAIAAAVALHLLAVLPLLQWLLEPDPATTSLLRRAGVLAAVVGAYWAVTRWRTRRAVDALRPAPLATLLGAASGAGLLALAVGGLFAIGAYRMVGWNGWDAGLLGVAGAVVVAATLEEVVFRGVLFLALERAVGTTWALWLQVLLFSVLHVPNLDPSLGAGAIALTIASGVLLGAMWTLVFVLSRNLWVAVANHAAWNVAVVLTGLPLSGLDDWVRLAPMHSVAVGPHWLTGGAAGPEDALPTIMLVALAVLVLVLLARRLGRFRAAGVAAPAPSPAPASASTDELLVPEHRRY